MSWKRHAYVHDMESGDGKRHNLFDIARGIIHQAYGDAPPRWFNPLILLAALIILDVRTLYGQPLIGSDWQEIMLITLAIYGGLLASMGLMGFGLLCGYDFARRVRASELYYRAHRRPALSCCPTAKARYFLRQAFAQLRQWMGAVACVFTAACKAIPHCSYLIAVCRLAELPHQAATADYGHNGFCYFDGGPCCANAALFAACYAVS